MFAATTGSARWDEGDPAAASASRSPQELGSQIATVLLAGLRSPESP